MAKMLIQPRQRENGENLESYFEYFDNLVTCNGWNDMEAAAFFKIAQPAKDSILSTISGFADETKKSYSAIREALLDAQKPLRATTIIRLKEVKRRPGQSLDAFASVICRYVDLLYPSLEPDIKAQMIRDQFFAGLDSRIQSSLAASLNSLKTLDALKNQATAIEAIAGHQFQKRRNDGGPKASGGGGGGGGGNPNTNSGGKGNPNHGKSDDKTKAGPGNRAVAGHQFRNHNRGNLGSKTVIHNHTRIEIDPKAQTTICGQKDASTKTEGILQPADSSAKSSKAKQSPNCKLQ